MYIHCNTMQLDIVTLHESLHHNDDYQATSFVEYSYFAVLKNLCSMRVSTFIQPKQVVQYRTCKE